MGPLLMDGFSLRGSHLIRGHFVKEDLRDDYPNYYKYNILELIFISRAYNILELII